MEGRIDDFSKRLAIRLYNMGLTYDEASSSVKLSNGSVKNIYREARDNGVYVSEGTNNQRLDEGIRTYFTGLLDALSSDGMDWYVKKIFERKILRKTIRQAEKDLSIDDLLISDPYQRLLNDVLQYPGYEPGLYNEFRKAKKGEYTIENFRSFARSYVLEVFHKNYMPPEFIDKKKLEDMIDGLTPREQKVIRDIYLEKRTQVSVGKDYAVSNERIGQIKRKALRKLRKPKNREILSRYRYPKAMLAYVSSLEEKNSELQDRIYWMQEVIDKTKSFLKDTPQMKGLLEIYLDLDNAVPSVQEQYRENLKLDLDGFGLSVRTAKCLEGADIRKIRDLAAKKEKELLNIKNFGIRCLKECSELLAGFNLNFGMKFD